jgi:outer membrane protein OmpA-like peptidoglycan-associated protein
MRNIIIGLSLIFFALSGIVLFKALNIPVNQTKQHKNPEGLNINLPEAEAEEASGKYPLDQPASQSVVQDSQAAAAMSAGDGANRNAETRTDDKTSANSNKTRVLAVIGAGAFNSGQIVIDNSLMHTIKEVVPHIQSSPDYRVYVEGHTDDMPIKVSSDKRFIDNMELSYLRAKAVASILVENGISLDRISINGYGDTRPITSNETDEDRIKNRRVEIKLVPEE